MVSDTIVYDMLPSAKTEEYENRHMAHINKLSKAIITPTLWYKKIKVTTNKRPKGLKGHLSIRDSTPTSC